jgi:membrane-bound serine protease (ClpP class)
MLFDSDDPGFQDLSPGVFIPTFLLVSGFFVAVAGLVFRSQVSKPLSGDKGLMDEIGVVKKAIAPEGKVLVHGELWNATAKTEIQEGVRVKVVRVKNLVVEVEPVE